MKYPPTRERGWPVSACQRSGSVKVDIGTGTASTPAEAGRSSAPNAADQPGGTEIAAPAGRGGGTAGSPPSPAAPRPPAAARPPLASQGSRPARAGTAASTQQASS